jgi:hypothetical protein
MKSKCLLACLFAFSCILMPTSTSSTEQTPSTTAPSSATQTGQRIGTIVSAAVDTAFPIIGKIMGLFKTTKPDEKTTQTDVATAVKKAQADFKAAAKQQLQPAATIATEIGVIQIFATAGVAARSNIATMSNLLSQASPDYDKIGTEWTIAKNNLADVLTLKVETIRAVREPTIQERCIALQNARKDLMVRIDANVDEAKKKTPGYSKQDLQDEITAMAALLKGFDALAAIEFATLQDDIDNLGKWANSAQGSPLDTPLKKPSQKMLRFITDAETKANKAANKN